MITPEALRLAQALNNRQDCEDDAADELRRLYSMNMELLRWKGTHAPRLVAVEGLLREAQQEAAARREAIANLASLDSERQANAMLTAELERLTAERDELERLCDATYVAQGADAYNHACSEMERWQAARVLGGKDAGTTGSLCDGIAWLYGHIQSVEAERDALRAALAAAPAPAPLTDEQMRDALRQCPYDTVEALRVRWLYAKDFARAIERAHGIGTEARAQTKEQSNG